MKLCKKTTIALLAGIMTFPVMGMDRPVKALSEGQEKKSSTSKKTSGKTNF